MSVTEQETTPTDGAGAESETRTARRIERMRPRPDTRTPIDPSVLPPGPR